MDVTARAIAFERQWLRTQATEVVPLTLGGQAVGDLVVTAHARLVYDHNAVVLDDGAVPAPEAVLTLLEQVQGGRGFDHRRLYTVTSSLADHLRPVMLSAGYQAIDSVVMPWMGTEVPARPVPGVEVVEADRDLVTSWTRATVAARPYASPDVIEDFVRLATRQHDLGVRFLVALADGEPVGGMRAYLEEDVAQVEELDVLATHRGRGLGALLLSATLARATSRDLVFLTADPDDWPAAWYARLGFGVAGRSSGFLRLPDAAGES